uniref:Ig-like domain-containing protein n=1 Tax=Myripristis murdjan TaxID=586833 RepID=A0A667WKI5_9TELE
MSFTSYKKHTFIFLFVCLFIVVVVVFNLYFFPHRRNLTKTAHVGEDVTLSCMRWNNLKKTSLFWIRLVAGNSPEFLGGTFNFDYDGVTETPQIQAKQEPGKFVLHITKAKLSDTAVYYCIKVDQLSMTFLKGTFLRIKDPKRDTSSIIERPVSEPVYEGDPVTLQCSLLSDSENKACPAEHSVFWFRAGSDESHPRIIYTHGNRSDGCEKSPEAGSPPQSCVYKFSKNSVSSSDAGTYYCAVATCGEILFGNATKLDIKGNQTIFILIQKCTFFFLLRVKDKMEFMVMNVIFHVFCHLFLQGDEDTLISTAVNFTRRKTGSG